MLGRGKAWIPALAAMAMVCSAFGVETTVKGGQMELLEKGEKVLFRKGVRMVRGGDVVEANEMVTTKRRDKITATGNVRLYRTVSSTESWRGAAQSGFYNTQTGEGYLIGKKEQARLTRTEILSSTSTREFNVLADRIDFAEDISQAVAKGRVYAKTIDPETKNLYEFWSDRAVYDGREKKVVLTGESQPIVKETAQGETKTITGDVITYRLADKVVLSDGNAMAVFYGEEAQR